MAQYKTPGVYVVEQNAFPNSVVEVATAVPAFIGYTQFADNKGTPLAGTPWRISSMAEFLMYFGGPPPTTYSLDAVAAATAPTKPATDAAAGDAAGGDAAATPPARPVVTDLFIGAQGARKPFKFTPQGIEYLLYYSMLFFFQNGGGPCYIVSVGTYDGGSVSSDDLIKGIQSLVKEQEPTMVLVPDAVRLSRQDCASVQKEMLMHCGYTMRNRFAILDVFGGAWDRQTPGGDCITDFRDDVGSSFLDFGAGYYPWVNTSIVTEKDLDFTKLANLSQLQTLITAELDSVLNPPAPVSPAAQAKAAQVKAVLAKLTGGDAAKTDAAPAGAADAAATPAAAPAAEGDAAAAVPAKADATAAAKPPVMTKAAIADLHKTLSVISAVYVQVLQSLQKKINLMPPAAGMAGLYTLVDNTRGVWKAPANISLNGVVSPCVNISNADQEDLNVPTTGKSVNAIRSFIGEGVMVWGARTLDGNSLDWRYLSVRRTMIMIEESLRLACKAYVFEPNTANTWVTIKSMVRNFLTSVWKRGGLAGASPDDAFQVFVGLGETMTGEDILEGMLKVTVLVAVSRPAEFIELTFQQQMQKS
ncbi:phage tail sheath family protein [Pandoraea commovens]|uniref:Phage tail protein n=1 Tax=Pandoraea commovens TaxID=2508289 RepID=A0A5E4RQQ7_9BURK|nr:phage tail sheath C-terminal domain-containing protein [Pandoraea commovens]UVA77257.1 phage tail sheath subtilisin-like domain-containing protein [Pandoraea commovens]VVD65353.1 phage tail protein [Pandoraea commovens]